MELPSLLGSVFGFPILADVPSLRKSSADYRNVGFLRLIFGSPSVIVDHQALLSSTFCLKFQLFVLFALLISRYLLRFVTLKTIEGQTMTEIIVVYL